MENNPDIDVVASNYEIINGKKSKLFKSRYKNNDEIRARLIFSNCICNSSTLMLLSTIRKHGIKYNEAYFVAQDYDFFVQVSKI